MKVVCPSWNNLQQSESLGNKVVISYVGCFGFNTYIFFKRARLSMEGNFHSVLIVCITNKPPLVWDFRACTYIFDNHTTNLISKLWLDISGIFVLKKN